MYGMYVCVCVYQLPIKFCIEALFFRQTFKMISLLDALFIMCCHPGTGIMLYVGSNSMHCNFWCGHSGKP